MIDPLRRRGRLFRIILTGLAMLALAFPLHAEVPQTQPRISIIIDDLGDQFDRDWRAVRLPGAVTLAFLPHTPHGRELAERAHRLGKEVMLHLPMQAVESHYPGPGTLTLDMTETEFMRTVEQNLSSIPHVTGINNHMGSLLTRHPGHMQWLMTDIKLHGGLFFVDSRTTAQSVALRLALENQVPAVSRDVFLDNDPSPAAIAREFERLITLARRHGQAIAIGHPFHNTLSLLERELPALKNRGIELVSVSALIAAPQPQTPLEADTGKNNKSLVSYQSPADIAAPPPLELKSYRSNNFTKVR